MFNELDMARKFKTGTGTKTKKPYWLVQLYIYI